MLSKSLLAWYDRCRRDLPWRAAPGQRQNPYRVWLSEIMLQQTRVEAVIPYYRRFVERWPSVESLAAARLEEVLDAWAGLGYYARARRLHACARMVAERHGGRFPDETEELRRLPGVGEYTAAAIAAIAFDRPAAAVDGNVERVMARMYAVEKPLPSAKPELRRHAQALVPRIRAGDFAQALMELGATVCLPRSPRCGLCPWTKSCLGRQKGIAEQLPRKLSCAPRPVRYGVAFCLRRKDGAMLMARRPPEGLLGGMLGLPGTDWFERRPRRKAIEAARPAEGKWRKAGVVQHVFTHFTLELEVRVAECGEGGETLEGTWVRSDTWREVPTAMRKALRLAVDGDSGRKRRGKRDT